MRRLYRRHILQLRLRCARAAPLHAATGAASLPHYFALRFPECGARLRLASSALIAVFFTVYAAGQLTSAGKVFEAAGFSYGAAVWAAAFAATFYTFLGGYRAVVWTDVAQGVAILAVLALFPAAFVMQAGGWHAFWAKLWTIDPALLSGTRALPPSPSPPASPRAASASWASRTYYSAS